MVRLRNNQTLQVPRQGVVSAYLAVAFWLLFCSVGETDQISLEQIVRDNKGALVFLSTKVILSTGEIKESTGTGFLLSSEGYVLTASHVLSPEGQYDRAQVEGAPQTRYGKAWPLDVIQDDPRRDLLLLKFKDVGIEWPRVPVGVPSRAAVGRKLYALGFPLNLDLSPKEGTLSNRNGPGGSWTTTLPLNLGDSGAPVFDDNGQVVALVIGGIPEARGIAFCLPVNYAMALLGIAGVNLPTNTPAFRGARPHLLLPPDGSEMTAFPRALKLTWSEVTGSRSYHLQIQIQDLVDSTWHPHPFGLGDRVVGTLSFGLEFVGSQPGRWRVAAISEEGEEGEFSAWSYFTFSDARSASAQLKEFPFKPTVLLKYKYNFEGKECEGYFLSDGLGRWAEITPGRNGCLETAYSFEQESRDGDTVLLHDTSRGYFVKVPLSGGWATGGGSAKGPFSYLHLLEKSS